MTPTRFPIVLLRPLGQLSVKCESQYTRGIAKCKQKSWHFLNRADLMASGDGLAEPCTAPRTCHKRGLTSKIALGELLKRGSYKRQSGEFKNLRAMWQTTGLHFATTALSMMTSDFPNVSPQRHILSTNPSSVWSAFG